MPRIAMIGAGSVIFCKTLMMDIMATEGLEDSTFVLMNRTEPKLRQMEAFANEVVRENGLPAKITATTDRRKALAAAISILREWPQTEDLTDPRTECRSASCITPTGKANSRRAVATVSQEAFPR